MGGPGSGRHSMEDFELRCKQIEEWSKQDNATALCQFCNSLDTYPDKIYEWRDSSEIFAKSLKRAQSRIAERLRNKLHDKTFPYNYGLFMSEIGFHDKFHYNYTESIKDNDNQRRMQLEEHKAKVASQQGNNVSGEMIAQAALVMDQLRSMQSDRKIKPNKVINEDQS